ncbi:ATP-dependent Clp protease proteolytic subunit [Novipirellula artificiosorum]|uniref:ATP-dependent Clp protease proteolytic subunit n=2 Tax=Novipirellula artificiosorum TaxID=2528016 RepID=A0A5C6D300_9BACT|nr:ATP-dependent Clp protease proteolytic subunit [Novipirellula artificiosorum]
MGHTRVDFCVSKAGLRHATDVTRQRGSETFVKTTATRLKDYCMNLPPVHGLPHNHELTNSHSYQSYQRQRQLTLGDLLLENRIVFLQGEIHYANANDVVMKLLYLQSENRRKDIHFYLNSPGGSVTATLAIYDTMQMLSCPVATYCVGEACSGAAVLLVGGSKGKRFCLPNSRVMLHQPMGGVGGQVSDIEIQAAEMFRYRDVLNGIISSHSGKSVEQIAKDTDRDFFLSASEAKDYGLVDDILTKPPATEEDDD